MHAWLVRASRFGEPERAFVRETVEVPSIGEDEVLVRVMAAGVNYNNVWAAKGFPVDVIAARQRAGERADFHIGGSDASGVVARVGAAVKGVAVGDEVVLHCGMWDRSDALPADIDNTMDPSFRIWGYESNYGSFAQYTRVKASQCLPKPRHLTWEEAAAYMLVGATAYRMLRGWAPHVVRAGDVVLVWGGAGGLGSMAIQLARVFGAKPVAVVSDASKIEHCLRLGAVGCVDRKRFSHWGALPALDDKQAMDAWTRETRAFGRAIWEAVGQKSNPRIVVEHPGEDTIPTSTYVCDAGGMVVICAGTTGYLASIDLRHHWMRQKRFQGSHFASDAEARATNDLVAERKLDPCLSHTFAWDELAVCHQRMSEGRLPPGNVAILVGAPREGLGRRA
ncbi:MAG: crotonyl-CoA carboxylase/reductase [Myxococcales bacterium]|nr:crotonyl-CoA carboxylase/reductase [Myxococcales bacterium]